MILESETLWCNVEITNQWSKPVKPAVGTPCFEAECFLELSSKAFPLLCLVTEKPGQPHDWWRAIKCHDLLCNRKLPLLPLCGDFQLHCTLNVRNGLACESKICVHSEAIWINCVPFSIFSAMSMLMAFLCQFTRDHSSSVYLSNLPARDFLGLSTCDQTTFDAGNSCVRGVWGC